MFGFHTFNLSIYLTYELVHSQTHIHTHTFRLFPIIISLIFSFCAVSHCLLFLIFLSLSLSLYIYIYIYIYPSLACFTLFSIPYTFSFSLSIYLSIYLSLFSFICPTSLFLFFSRFDCFFFLISLSLWYFLIVSPFVFLSFWVTRLLLSRLFSRFYFSFSCIFLFVAVWLFFSAQNHCYILTFDLAQKYYSKVIHRKEVTHSNGQ